MVCSVSRLDDSLNSAAKAERVSFFSTRRSLFASFTKAFRAFFSSFVSPEPDFLLRHFMTKLNLLYFYANFIDTWLY